MLKARDQAYASAEDQFPITIVFSQPEVEPEVVEETKVVTEFVFEGWN
jgi:hypothetical protein